MDVMSKHCHFPLLSIFIAHCVQLIVTLHAQFTNVRAQLSPMNRCILLFLATARVCLWLAATVINVDRVRKG